jgi:hypothetical protein
LASFARASFASGQLRQGQTRDSGFQPKARSIEATFLATSRFLSVARFPR